MMVGDYVVFEGQDSHYEGTVVAMFRKLNKHTQVLDGPLRCIVQDERGLLLIKNPDAVTHIEPMIPDDSTP